MADLTFSDIFVIAENDHYRFVIARCGDRWFGGAMESLAAQEAREAFASECLPVQPPMMFIFAQVSEGFEFGVQDRNRAIMLVGAIAQDEESSYGEVDRWFVPEGQRGKPEAFRCERCGEIGCSCNGKDCEGDFPL